MASGSGRFDNVFDIHFGDDGEKAVYLSFIMTAFFLLVDEREAPLMICTYIKPLFITCFGGVFFFPGWVTTVWVSWL